MEIWDPDGLQITNTAPGGNMLVDLTLEKTGSYQAGITENGIRVRDGSDMSILDPHLTFTVDPNANLTGEIFSYTFDGSEPSGDYNVGGRFINVNSGRQRSLDIESFSFSP